jgi:hypothetical protein
MHPNLCFMKWFFHRTLISNAQGELIASYYFNNQRSKTTGSHGQAILNEANYGTDRFNSAQSALNFDAYLETVSLPIIDGLLDVSCSVWFKTSQGGSIISGANTDRPNKYVVQVLPDGRITANIRNEHNATGISILGTINANDGVAEAQGTMPLGVLSI